MRTWGLTPKKAVRGKHMEKQKPALRAGVGCEKRFFFTSYLSDDFDDFHQQKRSESELRCMTSMRVAPRLFNLWCRFIKLV